jgi:cytochrome c oxidase cbb3-type subunit 4
MNLLRSLTTVALFVLYIALCAWTWSRRRRAEFDAAARIPLDPSSDGARTTRVSR